MRCSKFCQISGIWSQTSIQQQHVVLQSLVLMTFSPGTSAHFPDAWDFPDIFHVARTDCKDKPAARAGDGTSPGRAGDGDSPLLLQPINLCKLPACVLLDLHFLLPSTASAVCRNCEETPERSLYPYEPKIRGRSMFQNR